MYYIGGDDRLDNIMEEVNDTNKYTYHYDLKYSEEVSHAVLESEDDYCRLDIVFNDIIDCNVDHLHLNAPFEELDFNYLKDVELKTLSMGYEFDLASCPETMINLNNMKSLQSLIMDNSIYMENTPTLLDTDISGLTNLLILSIHNTNIDNLRKLPDSLIYLSLDNICNIDLSNLVNLKYLELKDDTNLDKYDLKDITIKI